MNNDTINSSLTFKSIVIYMIPGFFLTLDFLIYLKLIFKLDFNKVLIEFNISNFYSSLLSVIFPLCLGLLLEVIRTACFPKIILIKRNIPIDIISDPDYYSKLIDLIFIGGNLAYNLVIPVLISPCFFLIFLKLINLNIVWSIILSSILNILSVVFLFKLGKDKEEKFYRIIEKISNQRNGNKSFS